MNDKALTSGDVIPLGKTPVEAKSKASRKYPIFIDETVRGVRPGYMYDCEIACGGLNPVFSAVFVPRFRMHGAELTGNLITNFYSPAPSTISMHEAIYIRVLRERDNGENY